MNSKKKFEIVETKSGKDITQEVTSQIKAKEAKAPAAKKAKTAKAAAGETATATTGKKKKSSESGLKTTLGDLFKDHISNGADDKEESEEK